MSNTFLPPLAFIWWILKRLVKIKCFKSPPVYNIIYNYIPVFSQSSEKQYIDSRLGNNVENVTIVYKIKIIIIINRCLVHSINFL